MTGYHNKVKFNIINNLRKKGYYIIANSAFHSLCDLIAISGKDAKLIMIRGLNNLKFEHAEIDELFPNDIKKFKEFKVPCQHFQKLVYLTYGDEVRRIIAI